jgi:hypothetical protein
VKNKKLFLVTLLAALLLAATAAPAIAGGGGYCANGEGCDKSAEKTVCSGHGAFGAFSEPDNHWTLGQPPYFGDNELGSARGGATGANNAGLCGNPQN